MDGDQQSEDMLVNLINLLRPQNLKSEISNQYPYFSFHKFFRCFRNSSSLAFFPGL